MAALQPRATVPFKFNGLPLAAIPHEDDLWLTGEDIGRALEYADPRKGIKTLYERNTEELDRYSTVLKLPVSGQPAGSEDGVGDAKEGTCGVNLRPQVGSAASGTPPAASVQLRDVRVFSEEGVMVLTMLSSQPKAAAFRAWAVQVLKAYRHGNLVISNPANRDRLLETCIKEARFGNEAAFHTLIVHFGYPESIRPPAPSAPRLGVAASSRLDGAPGLVKWMIGTFLPGLAEEIRAGGGPRIDAMRRRRPNFRYWREVRETGTAFAMNHSGSDLVTILTEIAAGEGVTDEISANHLSHWLNALEPELNAIGWSRRQVGQERGRYLFRLVLREGGAS